MTQPSIRAVSGGGGNNESLMPPKRSGYVADGSPVQEDNVGNGVQDYWQSLVDEKEAGRFLGLTDRTMQAYRHRGGGPRYIRLSSRCLRYRRIDLREWVEGRMRSSTCDSGAEAI